MRLRFLFLPLALAACSGGTVLQTLRPNEICHLEWSAGPCTAASAEKFAPRTCFHVMAGDEDGDGMYWNPAIFGQVDAILSVQTGTVSNQRTGPKACR